MPPVGAARRDVVGVMATLETALHRLGDELGAELDDSADSVARGPRSRGWDELSADGRVAAETAKSYSNEVMQIMARLKELEKELDLDERRAIEEDDEVERQRQVAEKALAASLPENFAEEPRGEGTSGQSTARVQQAGRRRTTAAAPPGVASRRRRRRAGVSPASSTTTTAGGVEVALDESSSVTRGRGRPTRAQRRGGAATPQAGGVRRGRGRALVAAAGGAAGTAAAGAAGGGRATSLSAAVSEEDLESDEGARLLTTAEELELGEQVQELMQLQRKKALLATRLQRDPTRSEWATEAGISEAALTAVVGRGTAAKKRMVDANTRLVWSIARQYAERATQVDIDDLVQVGQLGLIKGVEKYDASRGFKLSTYVHWWIRQGIQRVMADESRTVRLPAHVHEEVTRLNRANRELTEELGEKPTPSQIGDRAGLTAARVSALQEHLISPKSTNAALGGGDDSDMTLGETISDEGADDMDEMMTEHANSTQIQAVLATLTAREREVLLLRHGLGADEQGSESGEPRQEYTLAMVGQLYNVTRERVRQIEAKALRKLRSRLAALEAEEQVQLS